MSGLSKQHESDLKLHTDSIIQAYSDIRQYKEEVPEVVWNHILLMRNEALLIEDYVEREQEKYR